MKIFNPIFQYLTVGIDNLGEGSMYSESVIRYLLDLLSKAIDTNQLNQAYVMSNFKVYDVLIKLIDQNEHLEIAGKGCLVLSHILWNNKNAQKVFCTPQLIEREIFLIDFNQLINESDPNASVDSLQEISFFALLAMINHSSGNPEVQALAGHYGIIETIIKLLKNGVYDPKKTACICLGQIIQPPNSHN